MFLETPSSLHISRFSSPENDALAPFYGEGFFRPHRYEIPFYLGHKTEGEAEYLAVDAVIEAVALLHRVEPYVFLQAFAHYLHYLCKGATQPGYLAYD